MLIQLLIGIPLAGALGAFLTGSNTRRPFLLPVVACLHLILVFAVIAGPQPVSPHEWIHLDAVGRLFLLEFSLLFAACAFYAVNYLQYRTERDNRALCTGFPICLAAMTLATTAHHLGLLWLAIETTTLAMAPLVYFNRNARSIEATWKYMLICSIGIAMALLGILFLGYSTVVAGFATAAYLSKASTNGL